MRFPNRRMAMQWLAGIAGSLGLTRPSTASVNLGQPRRSHENPLQAGSLEQPGDCWARTQDRVWLGEDFWANPMEDWRIVNGAAECKTKAGDRNVHLITRQLVDPGQTFQMSVVVQRVERGRQDGGAGFRIGMNSEIQEHRSSCFVKRGLNAGLIGNQLVLAGRRVPVKGTETPEEFHLELTGKPSGDQYELTLKATQGSEEIGLVTARVQPHAVVGNLAVVSNYDPQIKKGRGARYRFSAWQVHGDAVGLFPSRKFGPLLWSMYSLSDTRSKEGFVLKLSALTGPLGSNDNQTVELQVRQQDRWQRIAQQQLDPDAWVATFRIPNWDESTARPYRVVYREKHRDGSLTEHDWQGTIQANPSGRPLRVGALTCQNDYAFPYQPVAQNLVKLAPDMLYFSGDQIYENHGGYGIIREPAEPAILNYLRKFYQFGWAFREAMKDRPTLCLPDDHDVFQGNIWGEGGARMKDLEGGASSKGGYREPARMVNAVHKTCVAHHPDPYDPTPSKQEISVYFGEVVYGDVSFAVIADRQFKSGPERVETGSGRADHVRDADFDCSKLDVPGLVLLGDRQEEFLRRWSRDWRGHTMKVLLSQTVFAGVATHHGQWNGYLKADLDSGGWPQTPRNRAIEILRESMALHICGDQHLATLSQYGVNAQRDSNWSYCTPAIAAGYQRWWRPDEVGMPHTNRPEHGLPHTGEFVDGFGNLVYVYAVGNPIVSTAKNRYEKAHEKGSGFGMVTIDTQAKTYHLEAFRFLVDASDPGPDDQFSGWPVTIHQAENRGQNRLK